MKNESLYHTELESESIEHKQLYAAEELTFNVTEDILLHMEDTGVSKSDLADRLRKTKAYVSQLLSGSRNMTLRTLSDICFALEVKPMISFAENKKPTIESTPILKKSASTWQDVVIECNEFNEGITHGVRILNKSNVIVRGSKDFWKKVA